MKRTMMTWMLAGTLLATTAAACGSDDEKKDEKPASTEAVSDDNGSTSGNAEVAAFCDAVDEYIDAVKGGDDVAAKLADLQTQATSLTAAVATDAAAQQQLQACLTKMATGG